MVAGKHWNFFGLGLLLIFIFKPSLAWAHLVNADVGVFYAGMLHPLTSAEHLLPMLALALLASQCGKRAGRFVIMIFPLALIIGIVAGNFFGAGSFAQPANLLALMILGVMLISARRINIKAIAAAAAITGLILGFRSGVDMADAGVGLQFIPGVALTGFMLMTLSAAWIPRTVTTTSTTIRILVGSCFFFAGMIMLGLMTAGNNAPDIRSIGMPTEESLKSLVQTENLSVAFVTGAILLSLIWGAGHALTPGHGKAIVAAYLVGARSTPWHAVYLGITVTVTHTLGVFALGLVALFASNYILPETLFPWLGALSGIIVLVLGATILKNRMGPILRTGHEAGSHVHSHSHAHHHDHIHVHVHNSAHDHDHHHDPHEHHTHGADDDAGHGHTHLPPGSDGTPVTWRSLLGLGISGGLLPCPSALVLLLTAVSLQRTAFGMVMVIFFSIGLAGVLTAVGLLFIKGSRLIRRIPKATSATRYLPAVSAVLIVIIGAVITWDAVLKIGR